MWYDWLASTNQLVHFITGTTGARGNVAEMGTSTTIEGTKMVTRIMTGTVTDEPVVVVVGMTTGGQKGETVVTMMCAVGLFNGCSVGWTKRA